MMHCYSFILNLSYFIVRSVNTKNSVLHRFHCCFGRQNISTYCGVFGTRDKNLYRSKYTVLRIRLFTVIRKIMHFTETLHPAEQSFKTPFPSNAPVSDYAYFILINSTSTLTLLLTPFDSLPLNFLSGNIHFCVHPIPDNGAQSQGAGVARTHVAARNKRRLQIPPLPHAWNTHIMR